MWGAQEGAGLGVRGCMHVFGTMDEETPKQRLDTRPVFICCLAPPLQRQKGRNIVQAQNNVAADVGRINAHANSKSCLSESQSEMGKRAQRQSAT